MGRNLDSLFIVLLAVLATTLLHGSAAQTKHVVGDSTGWTIPSGGPSTYATWASNKIFSVGDILVFNFPSGAHNVAKVTKSDFDACNAGSTTSTVTTSPASVTLNEAAEHYYICTIGRHCSLGMKLAVNVSKGSSPPSSSPAPQPSGSRSPTPKTSPVSAPAPEPTTPPPSPVQVPAPEPSTPPPSPVQAPAPAPSGSTRPVTYTVGDNLGWTVPASASAYRTWSSGKNFKVGDILVFNFPKNAHNVEEVTKKNYDSCNFTSPLATYSDPPVRVTLNKSGEHYFICGIPGHCAGGQKLATIVSGRSSTGATPPSSAASPNSPPSPSPAGEGGVSSPPPNSSGATSIGAVGLSATMLSVAAAFLC